MERRDAALGNVGSVLEAGGLTKSGTGWVRRGIRLLLGVVAVLALLATPVSAYSVLYTAWTDIYIFSNGFCFFMNFAIYLDYDDATGAFFGYRLTKDFSWC